MRATTVLWRCQIRSAAGWWGLVYIASRRREEAETAPGPDVVAGSARSEQRSGGWVHQEVKAIIYR